jgi:hypothetical protein
MRTVIAEHRRNRLGLLSRHLAGGNGSGDRLAQGLSASF